MGNYVSSAMDANMEKQQKFMLDMNRMTIERQIHMQDAMREKMMAMQVAKARDQFLWMGTFYCFAALAMFKGFSKTRKPAVLAPLLPLTFVVGYVGDLAYGTKMQRMKAEAENVIQLEGSLLDMPAGLPTVDSIDLARFKSAKD